MTEPSEIIGEAQAARLLPERDRRGHKGTFGRVVMVAGSLDYAGAALMAGTAALRTGGGLVTLCLPSSLQPALAGRVPELITRGLPEVSPGELDAVPAAASIVELEHDALLVGPGLRPGRGTSRLVGRLLAEDGAPAVVDAGALNALATVPGWWSRIVRRCVLTPHPGEFRRLGIEPGSDDGQRRRAALEAATAWGQVVVLKGAASVVAEPGGRVLVAPFELPGLATAGSGDVLAGIVTSLLGQGVEPFDAAALGVYLHGRAGEQLSERLGDAGLLATDLLLEIPRARRQLALLRGRDSGGQLGFVAPRQP
ncbi:MAG: NAD(P)H-hydrate dehydratase [Chloroflexota bacterium]